MLGPEPDLPEMYSSLVASVAVALSASSFVIGDLPFHAHVQMESETANNNKQPQITVEYSSDLASLVSHS